MRRAQETFFDMVVHLRTDCLELVTANATKNGTQKFTDKQLVPAIPKMFNI